ncbi:unnamed protein product [Scytosiphon promiscuus]
MLLRALLSVRRSRPRPLVAQAAAKCSARCFLNTTSRITDARWFSSSPSPTSSSADGDGSDQPPCLREYIATLGVFFTLPEQGITSPEILTRCSATPVRQTPSSPLRFLAAAHAVMPWAFPGLYDESHAWLSFLDETNVRYYAELRDPLNGAVLTNHELVNLAKHPSRDMAALGLKAGGDGDGDAEEHDNDQDPEGRFLEHARSEGIPFSPLPLRRRVIDQADALRIVGYEVREQPGGLGQGEDPGMMMILAQGTLAARTAVQAFVETEHETLNPGMCGAAVLDAGLELCGCVEGVVPTAPPEAEVDDQVRALQGMPCVVEWKDLDHLLTASMGDGEAGGEDVDAAADTWKPR